MVFDQVMTPEALGAAGIGGALALAGVSLFIGWVILYIYTSIAMMHTAKRLRKEPYWLAWIPIARNALVAKMAKMHWWPLLLLVGAIVFSWLPILAWLFGIAFSVFYIIWLWNICESRKLPGWVSILIIVPVLGPIWLLVLWGLLAWNK
ncbi:MAG: hypothetical protein ACOCZV_02105 [Nanoarchaeota archaeon]